MGRRSKRLFVIFCDFSLFSCFSLQYSVMWKRKLERYHLFFI